VTRRRQHHSGQSQPNVSSPGLLAATVALAVLLVVSTVRLVLQ
jgi:hypothetical protein